MERWWTDLAVATVGIVVTAVAAVAPYARLVETPNVDEWFVPWAPFLVGAAAFTVATRRLSPSRRLSIAGFGCAATALAAQIAVERHKGPERWIAETTTCFALLTAAVVLAGLALAVRMGTSRR